MAKVKAYEVRVGDVVKGDEGGKFRVELIEQDPRDEPDKVYICGWGVKKSGLWQITTPDAHSKVKVFERKYK